jgi:hypothetical protein
MTGSFASSLRGAGARVPLIAALHRAKPVHGTDVKKATLAPLTTRVRPASAVSSLQPTVAHKNVSKNSTLNKMFRAAICGEQACAEISCLHVCDLPSRSVGHGSIPWPPTARRSRGRHQIVGARSGRGKAWTLPAAVRSPHPRR